MSRSGQNQTALGPNVLGTLRNKIKSGEIVLFTGAGFSRDAKAEATGKELPTSEELRSILWSIAFPGANKDNESSLGDVFDCAIQKAQTQVCITLNTHLRVDSTNLPDYYSLWFSVPWARAYTLNIDDLAKAAERAFDLPRPIQAVSGQDPLPTLSNSLTYVHLNGQLMDAPNVTFSAPQYGQRFPGRDPWYTTLAADLLSMSVIFVGTTLDEPPLWEHLELRGQKAQSREYRPKSYLVTPHLPLPRQNLLKKFNIEHIPMDTKQFANDVLADMKPAIDEGHSNLSRTRDHRRKSNILSSISQLRLNRQEINLGQYLLGREPTFQDILEGYAVKRSFEEELLDNPSSLQPRIVLITGTAGTGKSTALRRLGLHLDSSGKNVGWCDIDNVETDIPRIRNAISESDYDFVIVDNVERFAAQAGPLLRQLGKNSGAPRIIAAARSTHAERLELRSHLEPVDANLIFAPPLTDSDIDALISALKEAGLLGQLAGKTLAEQQDVFKSLAGRQLLVAMIEATSGRRFSEKVQNEYSQLPTKQQQIYAICALATRYRIGLTTDEILAAIGDTSSDELETIDSLLRQHLLFTLKSNRQIWVRHRIIAEQVASLLRKTRQLAQPVEGLSFAMASKHLREPSTSSRAFRLMVRLINHRFMHEEIRDATTTRNVYESLAHLLKDDFHFWLQRGSFELEEGQGDLNLAENYLNQARGLAGDDHRVRTAWAHMSLRRAAELAQRAESNWRHRAEEAMEELQDIINTRSKPDPYVFHVLGSQGLHYIRQAPLTLDERISLLGSLRETVQRGVNIHKESDELKQLFRDLEREYLLQAVHNDGAN